MAGFPWPKSPDFVNESERLVFEALRRDLREGDALLCGLRFTNPVQGDIEIDIMLVAQAAA